MNMRRFIMSALLSIPFLAGLQAQDVYNQFFEKQEGNLGDYISSFDSRVLQRRIKIDGQTVIDVYEQGTGRWLGFRGDLSKFNLEELPYLQKEGIVDLLADYAPPFAVAIHQEEVIYDMPYEAVIASWGEPNKLEDTEDGQVLRYDWGAVSLESGIVVGIEHFDE